MVAFADDMQMSGCQFGYFFLGSVEETGLADVDLVLDGHALGL
jgi:hypothetical protein